MYLQNYFASGSIKLESFTSLIQLYHDIRVKFVYSLQNGSVCLWYINRYDGYSRHQKHNQKSNLNTLHLITHDKIWMTYVGAQDCVLQASVSLGSVEEPQCSNPTSL